MDRQMNQPTTLKDTIREYVLTTSDERRTLRVARGKTPAPYNENTVRALYEDASAKWQATDCLRKRLEQSTPEERPQLEQLVETLSHEWTTAFSTASDATSKFQKESYDRHRECAAQIIASISNRSLDYAAIGYNIAQFALAGVIGTIGVLTSIGGLRITPNPEFKPIFKEQQNQDGS